MKVRELMEHLERQDPDVEILCLSGDEDILPLNEVFRIFKIKAVTGSPEDNEPVSQTGVPTAVKHVSLEVTSAV